MVELFHNLPGFLLVELFGSRTTPSKSKKHFIRKWKLGILLLPLFLEIVTALLFRFVQGLSLFLDGTFALGKKSHRAGSKLLFEDTRVSYDFHGFVGHNGFVRCHLCLSFVVVAVVEEVLCKIANKYMREKRNE